VTACQEVDDFGGPAKSRQPKAEYLMPLVGLEVILEAGFSVTGLSAEGIMATKCSVPDGYHSITPLPKATANTNSRPYSS